MAILKLMHLKEAKQTNPAQHLKNVLNYIFNPQKTENLCTVGGNHCPSISATAAFEQMMKTKKGMGKESGRQGYHFILSFSPEDLIDAKTAASLTEDYILAQLDEYECVYAIHTDKQHMHAHIVFNSVSYRNGTKFHYKKGEWEKLMLPELNRLCEKYGVSRLVLDHPSPTRGQNINHKEWEERQHGQYTVLQHIQRDLDRLVCEVSSYEELIIRLVDMGYELRPGAAFHKHLSLKPPGHDKSYRTTSLGEGYTPEGLNRRIKQLHQDAEKNPKEAPKNQVSDMSSDVHKRKKCVITPYYHFTRIIVMQPKKKIVFKKRKRISSFQRSYLHYCRFFLRLRNSGSYTWKDSKDILLAQEWLDMLAYVNRSHLQSPEALAARKKELEEALNQNKEKTAKRACRCELKALQKLLELYPNLKQQINQSFKI